MYVYVSLVYDHLDWNGHDKKTIDVYKNLMPQATHTTSALLEKINKENKVLYCI